MMYEYKPKRPMSAYMMWLNSVREQIKADNPGLKITEIAKKGGEMWRGMKHRSVWEEKAAKAREQYSKDLESFTAKGGGGPWRSGSFNNFNRNIGNHNPLQHNSVLEADLPAAKRQHEETRQEVEKRKKLVSETEGDNNESIDFTPTSNDQSSKIEENNKLPSQENDTQIPTHGVQTTSSLICTPNEQLFPNIKEENEQPTQDNDTQISTFDVQATSTLFSSPFHKIKETQQKQVTTCEMSCQTDMEYDEEVYKSAEYFSKVIYQKMKNLNPENQVTIMIDILEVFKKRNE